MIYLVIKTIIIFWFFARLKQKNFFECKQTKLSISPNQTISFLLQETKKKREKYSVLWFCFLKRPHLLWLMWYLWIKNLLKIVKTIENRDCTTITWIFNRKSCISLLKNVFCCLVITVSSIFFLNRTSSKSS